MKKYNYIMFYFLFLLIAFTSVSCSEEDEGTLQKYPAPTITEFSPSEGLPTSVVTIKGSEFGNERTERIGRVYFGGVEATEYVSWSDNEIQVRVPEGGITGPITLWVHKNSVQTSSDFTCVPGAEITGITPSPAFPGGTIEIIGRNFQYFLDKGLTAEDIIVEFASEEGTVITTAEEFISTKVVAQVPLDAKGGTVSVSFGDYQKVTGPELPLAGDIKFVFSEYVETSGSISVADGNIDSTKDGAYVIFKFTSEATGLFDVYTMAATTKDGSSLNVNIGDNLTVLKTQALNDDLTRELVNGGSWTNDSKATYGPFYLEEGKEYYLKLTFLQENSGTWVGNVHEMGLTLSSDQSQTPVNPGGGGSDVDYVIFQHNFNSGTSYYPFRDAWAWEPNYIKIVDQCLEFYYNYQALQNDDRRERRGCEVTCDFKTTSEGWYGFKIFLPEGKFPMDESGIIIAQIFNQGCKNCWAGHVSIDKGSLKLSHRKAMIDPTVGDLGKLETNKWYSVVVYFKAGKNGKGRLKAWIGDDMVESSPVYDSGSCDFGYGHWVNDDTLDDTGTNPECPGYNGTYDALGCKFGLYVTNKTDITIRFDDIKALQGNPSGAFDIVKPKQ